MTCEQALRLFKEATRSAGVRQTEFDSVFAELTRRKPRGDGFSDEDALSLLLEWYESAKHIGDRNPLTAIKYCRPRIWVTFLAWSDFK